MIKFSLCIEPVLAEIDFYDRIKVAAELGLDAIEFWDTEGRDVSRIGRLATENNLKVAICCVKGAWSKRMNLPAPFVVENVKESVRLAKEMGCNSLIALSGDVEGKADSQKNILIENLKRVADILVKEDVTLNLEALNSLVDHKGYYLDSSSIGFEIVKCVGCDHIKILFDVYHMQIMEGNIIENITKNTGVIGHFHSAGVPGRHEHFNGENDYHSILNTVDKSGYNRFFGLEYWPTYDNKQSIADVMKYLKG
ncbi:MAG: TIM barrel protein [Ruminiclostridium sp.]|nr:TIM barrel protein [Ruminiclostridium sp.]